MKTISNVRTISMEMSDFIHIQNVIGLPLMMSDTITLKRGNNKANLNQAIRVRTKSLEIKLWSGSSALLTLKADELVRKCWSLNKDAVPVSIRFNFIYNNGGTENVSVTADLNYNINGNNIKSGAGKYAQKDYDEWFEKIFTDQILPKK